MEIIKIFNLYVIYSFKNLTKYSIYIKKNQIINIQRIKSNLMELRKIILPALKNIKKFTGIKKHCTFIVRFFIQ